MADWTLIIATPAGVVKGGKSLAAWGLADVTLDLGSLRAGILSAQAPGADILAEPIADFGDQVTLYDHHGIVRFKGTRVSNRAVARGNGEDRFYTFADAWYALTRRVFHQPWGPVAIGGVNGASAQTPHLVLNYSPSTNTILTVGDMITAVINYAQTEGVAIQVGSGIDIQVKPPIREVVGQMCSQVIIDQLRFAPDAVAWLDYTFDPPAFNCLPPAQLATVNLPILSDTSKVSHIEIRPSDETKVNNVAIRFEVLSEINGRQSFGLVEDVYPPGTTGREDNALSETINAFGGSRTGATGFIESELLDYTNLDWWKAQGKCPIFAVPTAAEVAAGTKSFHTITVVSTARNGTQNLPNKIVSSSGIADWMKASNGGPVEIEREDVQMVIDIKTYTTLTADPVGQITSTRKTLMMSVDATDSPVGVSDYSTVSSWEEGDPIPAGLAQFLHASLSRTEYEGAFTLVETECSNLAPLGAQLNLIGGRVAWASMAARIQATSEHIDSGETRITIGPTEVLSLGALIELLRANRTRRRWTAPQTQTDGDPIGTGQVDLGEITSNVNSQFGTERHDYLSVQQKAASTTPYKIAFDSSVDGDGRSPGTLAMSAPTGQGAITCKTNGDGTVDIQTIACGGRRLYIRAAEVCVNNVVKHALFLMSDPY